MAHHFYGSSDPSFVQSFNQNTDGLGTTGHQNPWSSSFQFTSSWPPYPPTASIPAAATPTSASPMAMTVSPPPTSSRPANCSCPHPHAFFLPVNSTPAMPTQVPSATQHLDNNGNPYTYVSNLRNSNRTPVPPPKIDHEFPAAHFINSTGGAGTEPGYNYFFPNDHAKVIVLKWPEAPWIKAPGPNVQVPFYAAHIPHCVTMSEVLTGFGATNRNKSKNQIHRIYPQGGGRWGHMEEVKGDDVRYTTKTVKEMGWCRRDKGGELGVVYLWIFRG